MSKTTLDYDPFLCEECSKYGYCIKKNKQKEDGHNDKALKEKVEIKNVNLIYQDEEIECLA